MDALGILILFSFVVTGCICLIAFVILLLIGLCKKRKDFIKKAFIIPGIYVILVIGILLYDYGRQRYFNRIPQLSVRENKVTILNEGAGSMGSNAKYVLSQNSNVTVSEAPVYRYRMNEKFGYIFEVTKPGTFYVMICEYDYGNISYVDIYKLSTEKNHTEAEWVEHVNVNAGDGRKQEYSDMIERTSKAYNFKAEELNKIFE